MAQLFTAWDDAAAWNDAAIWFEGLVVEALLPPNSTSAEFALEQATARVADPGAPLRPLWNPDDCPAELLPWLAWALGVDEWDGAWSDSAKRAAIRESVSIHRHKGTVAAIRRSLINAGYGDAQIIERYGNRNHAGALHRNGAETYSGADHWAEYRVVMGRPITLGQAERVRGILATIAPLRCHLKQLDFQQATFLHNRALRYNGAATHGAA